LLFVVLVKKQRILPVGILIEYKVITICAILVIKKDFHNMFGEIKP